MKRLLFQNARPRRTTLDPTTVRQEDVPDGKGIDAENNKVVESNQEPIVLTELNNTNHPNNEPSRGIAESTSKASAFTPTTKPLTRIKSLVHVKTKRPIGDASSKSQSVGQPVVERTCTNESTAASKKPFHVFARMKRLAHLGSKTHLRPEPTRDIVSKEVHQVLLKHINSEGAQPCYPLSDTTESTTSAAASVKEPEEYKPRSISPAQFAELVDASIASETAAGFPASLNTSLTSVPTIEAVLSSAISSAAGHESEQDKGMTSTPAVPSAAELATKILALTTELPSPESPPSPGKIDVVVPPKAKDGRPIPPPAANENVQDEQLAECLRSRKVMNGSEIEGAVDERLGMRKSVWDALDAIQFPWGSTEQTSEGSGGEPSQVIGDESVMLCFPLIPTADAKVELAQVVYVPVEPGISSHFDANKGAATSWPWPLKGLHPPNTGVQSDKGPDALEQPGLPGSSHEPQDVPPSRRKVWVPSTTHLSLQVAWWGYRIFLPPPVLEELVRVASDVSRTATMITTALTWLLENLPIDMIPVTVRPVVMVLRRIVPFIGYIGAFIAWSITSIKSLDKGYGVQFSATWLLPIALIPFAMGPPPAADEEIPKPKGVPNKSSEAIHSAELKEEEAEEDPSVIPTSKDDDIASRGSATAMIPGTNIPQEKETRARIKWSLTKLF